LKKRERLRLKRERIWKRKYALFARRYASWNIDLKDIEYDPTQSPRDAFWLEVSYMDFD